MHIMLSTFAYISLASDFIVVGGEGWAVEGLVCGIKIPQQDFAPKMQGGLSAMGAYLWDTMVLVNS